MKKILKKANVQHSLLEALDLKSANFLNASKKYSIFFSQEIYLPIRHNNYIKLKSRFKIK
ncbi:hypothetical protein Epro_1285 [Endomicrobium proavitum]|uniref:Uncharacterized protein n=1 Tax=Endomicrobium proavitum TaxID=1408281 RepID=A0A0G3WJ22_9BACT|nr:hypothetical protein Epro_1285 [Endomicrobium proavitum]